MLDKELLSYYVGTVCKENKEIVQAIKAIETARKHQNKGTRADQMNLYTLGYLLSGDRTFRLDYLKFTSVESLTLHMKEIMDVSYEDFSNFCNRIIMKDSSLDPQFEAWLIALGNRKALEEWKKRS